MQEIFQSLRARVRDDNLLYRGGLVERETRAAFVCMCTSVSFFKRRFDVAITTMPGLL